MSSSATHVQGMAQNVLGFLEDMMVAPVREGELEVVPFDDLTDGGTWGEMERWKRGEDAKLGGDE